MNEHEQKSRPFIYVRERPFMRSLKLNNIVLDSIFIKFMFVCLFSFMFV